MANSTYLKDHKTVNGIDFYIYQLGRLVTVYWDGSPIETMPREAWTDLELTLIPKATTLFQPVYVSCVNRYVYSVQNTTSSGTIRFYPRSGAITPDDRITGQLVYFSSESAK